MAETWNEQVINILLSRQDLSITEVKNFEAFLYLIFDQELYSSIVSFIKKEDWESIKSINPPVPDFREDLILAKFNNQNNQECLATIYDSDELWQDPKIIDVFIKD